MIQRPQSIFLLLVALMSMAALIQPLWIQHTQQTVWTLDAWGLSVDDSIRMDQVRYRWPYVCTALGTLVAALNSLYALFRYDNRKLQSRLVACSSLLMTCVLVWVLYLTACQRDPLAAQRYGGGFYALLVGVVANVAARRGIRRDEERIRSADRVR